MADGDKKIVDMNVNPQAAQPGNVLPQRTPGSAPSVVPLPEGADPTAGPGEHPLPEQAIEDYPAVAEVENNKASTGPGSIYDNTDYVTGDDVPATKKTAPAAKTTGTSSTSATGSSSSGASSTK